ncbi:ribonuclease H-like domain-containing protein [Tanacetum coccineum]
MPSRPDLSFAGLDDSVYKTKVSETETSISKTSKDIVEKPKTVRPSAPIIEDWDTDSDNNSVFRPKTDQTKPKFTKINFVKSDENVKSVNKENTHKQVEYPRKSQSPRGNRRNWNGMMTQKLGNGFEFIKKACFVCGSFNHLIKDCDFHDNKMVEKPVLNNKGRVTGQREIRPVWNNVQRVNHQNKLTHPHPKRNFVPTAVATKLGQVPVNAAKQNSPRAAASISTARPVNTAAPKSKVNDALPKTYSYFKAHSPVRRAFNQKSAAKTYNLNEKVKTARVNNVTTTGPKAVVSAAVGYGENAVKSSACWIWRPTGNVIDHTSKDSGSYMFKRFDYVDPTRGHSQVKIRSLGPQEETKFLIFECRQNNMYSFDLKNVIPSRGLTCLFAKATIDESNLWHRRLGHINFKTMNKLVKGNLVRVTAGNQTNKNAGIKDNTQQYILLPLLYDSPKSSDGMHCYDASFTNADDLPTDPLMPDLEDTADLLNTGIFSGAYDDEDVSAEANLNNLETTMNVSHIPTTKIHKDHPKDQIIGDINSATQTRRMTKIFKELAMRDDRIFISQDKYMADLLKKFDFVTMKTASTPIETDKALLKDEEAAGVDVHLYKSMIGSLMYLIASRPDIMFAVCACSRFQVTPKVSHLHDVKRIFRYLKGQPKLGL